MGDRFLVVNRTARVLVPLCCAIAVQASVGCSATPQDRQNKFTPAAHVPYPQIPTGGGPTLAFAQIVTASFAGDAQASELTTFVGWLSQSGWLGLVGGEYGVRGIDHHAHVALDGLAPSDLTDTAVAALLEAKLADGTIPSAQGASSPLLYVLFLPPGTTVTRFGGDVCSSGARTSGYHDALEGGSKAPYVVVPTCYPPFSASLSQTGGMELETARLLVNAMTDPSPRNEPAYALTDNSNSWTAMGTEVADFCWGRLVQEGGYTLQRVWSNAAARADLDPCVPGAGLPFGISAAPSSLQMARVGVPFSFTVTGWSTAPVDAWAIAARAFVGDFAMIVTLDRDTLNNGGTATLRVTIPYAVPSGTYGAVLVRGSNGGSDAVAWPASFLVR